MPAALTMDQLTVDQSLVDRFLERIDRFVKNVDSFEATLNDMRRKSASASEKEEPVYQETMMTAPNQDIIQEPVITADDINIDELLKGIDLSGADMSM